MKKKKNLAIAALASFVMAAVYIVIQAWAIGGRQNLDVWFSVIPKINLALIVLFSLLFGVLLALQIDIFKSKTCGIGGKTASASGGVFGTALAFLVPACPACVSFAALILPAATAASFAQILIENSSYLLLLSIALMLFGMMFLGGFKD